LLPALYGIVWSALGALTWKQCGMYTDAETLYRTIIEKNPVCWMSHNNLGLLLARIGLRDEAIVHYQKALEINPNSIQALNNLAGAYLQKMQVAEAMRLLEKSLALAKAEGDESLVQKITENLGRLYRASNSFQVNPDAHALY